MELARTRAPTGNGKPVGVVKTFDPAPIATDDVDVATIGVQTAALTHAAKLTLFWETGPDGPPDTEGVFTQSTRMATELSAAYESPVLHSVALFPAACPEEAHASDRALDRGVGVVLAVARLVEADAIVDAGPNGRERHRADPTHDEHERDRENERGTFFAALSHDLLDAHGVLTMIVRTSGWRLATDAVITTVPMLFAAVALSVSGQVRPVADTLIPPGGV